MEQHHNDGIMSAMLGFILALGNNFFGWLNKLPITADWNAYFQAAVTGFVGATFAFFANKIWQSFFKKKKKGEES